MQCHSTLLTIFEFILPLRSGKIYSLHCDSRYILNFEILDSILGSSAIKYKREVKDIAMWHVGVALSVYGYDTNSN